MPYPQALRKNNRKRYKKFKKDFDDNFYWTTVNDFGGEKAVEFYNLYKAVLNKAKNKFEFFGFHIPGNAEYNNSTNKQKSGIYIGIVLQTEWNYHQNREYQTVNQTKYGCGNPEPVKKF